MVKFVPLLLLGGMASAVVVAAPNPPKEGLVSHEAAGKAYVVRKFPDRNGEWWITANLKVRYVVAGQPGETYTVELWLGLPEELIVRDRVRAHFDTQEVTVPGTGSKLTEVKGLFDRRHYDRTEEHPRDRPAPPWFELKPGTYSLVPPGRLGAAWECRLVVKKNGKTLSDTGYSRVVLPPVIDI